MLTGQSSCQGFSTDEFPFLDPLGGSPLHADLCSGFWCIGVECKYPSSTDVN
jgi:hypothetical protein